MTARSSFNKAFDSYNGATVFQWVAFAENPTQVLVNRATDAIFHRPRF